MIFTEPTENYLDRLSQESTMHRNIEQQWREAFVAAHDPWYHGDDWDRHIIRALRDEGGPVIVSNLAWRLAKAFTKGKKRRREVWLYVERRIRDLIRLGVIERVERRFCRIDGATGVDHDAPLPPPNL